MSIVGWCYAVIGEEWLVVVGDGGWLSGGCSGGRDGVGWGGVRECGGVTTVSQQKESSRRIWGPWPALDRTVHALRCRLVHIEKTLGATRTSFSMKKRP